MTLIPLRCRNTNLNGILARIKYKESIFDSEYGQCELISAAVSEQ